MRTGILLISALLLTPAASTAQGGPDRPPCGDLPNPQILLEYYARYFTAPDFASIRDRYAIAALPEDATRSVVEEPPECGPIFGKLMAHLGSLGEQEHYQEHGFKFTVLRYGPYYGVLVVKKPVGDFSSSEVSTGYADLFIFMRSGLEPVGRIAG